MSLRLRLAIVLLLGLSALAFAALAVTQILSGTQASREHAAEAEADAAAQALVDTFPARTETGSLDHGPGADLRRQLHQIAVSVMRPVPSSSGGYCNRDGVMFAGSARDRPDTREGGSARLHPLSSDLEV